MHIVFFFFFFCRIPVVLESRPVISGGGGAHPLHPPPRSAPGPSVLVFTCTFSLSLIPPSGAGTEEDGEGVKSKGNGIGYTVG